MFEGKTITFIGSGMMATAMMAGLLQKGTVAKEQILAVDILAERRDFVSRQYGVRTAADAGAAAAEGDIVVLAIKPQSLSSAAPPMKGKLHSTSLLLSILAGTPLKKLTKACDHNVVVRAMPNTPAQIGQGMTMWTATPAVTELQRQQAQAILASFGKEIYAENEHYLNMATAINGSGPGFVFLMLEALIDAGVHMGFSRPVAEELVMQTMLGSVMYALDSDLHLAELRNQVTSAGGTTAEGLAAMERGGLRTVLADGLWAAYKRSVALGKS